MIESFAIEELTHTGLVERDTFAGDILEGLTARPRRISSKYFYDSAGSEIFRRITQLDEYYLTKCEHEILKQKRERIAELAWRALSQTGHKRLNLVELGSGDGHKSRLVIEQFLADGLPFDYVPIDISTGAMQTLMTDLRQHSPDVSTRGLISDYFQGLNWLARKNENLNLVLFLGSNIGNFHREACRGFLCRMWNSLSDGDLVLIGFDLKKDVGTLVRAYNDAAGVTSEFNLNLLARINRELGGHFDLGAWEHYAPYNPNLGSMESYLISSRRQKVEIEGLNRTFEFDRAEPIHTEYSYKYSLRDIQELAIENGFELIDNLIDSKGWFADSIWRVHK